MRREIFCTSVCSLNRAVFGRNAHAKIVAVRVEGLPGAHCVAFPNCGSEGLRLGTLEQAVESLNTRSFDFLNAILQLEPGQRIDSI